MLHDVFMGLKRQLTRLELACKSARNIDASVRSDLPAPAATASRLISLKRKTV
eukprot:m.100732 g.100732  ORF g.100732 m.100732 type:complete len:53 (-) comp8943_c0_seq1:435-593(-)